MIANIVTSPHHLSATMVHGPRAPDDGALRPARAGRDARAGACRAPHLPRRYGGGAPGDVHAERRLPINAVRLREQITSTARTVLLVLLAASGLVFVIACSNVANLILARSVRREGELAVRAALGASAAALRRTLLAESLLLCGAGAVLGVLIARPMVAVLARYAARFSVRALDVTVDATLSWVGVAPRHGAGVLLAFVPRLPSAESPKGLGLSSGTVRVTSGTNRRLRAVRGDADRRVVRAAGRRGMLLKTLLALQAAQPGFQDAQGPRRQRARHVVREDARADRGVLQGSAAPRRRSAGRAAGGSRRQVPWRDAGNFGPGFAFSVEGTPRRTARRSAARFRTVTPGFFATLGVPLHRRPRLQRGRRLDAERVVIVSQAGAAAVPGTGRGEPTPLLDRPVMKFIDISPEPRRIVGVVADVDDENIMPETVDAGVPPVRTGDRRRPAVRAREHRPVRAGPAHHAHGPRDGGRSAGRARRTLADVRAEVLAPDRLNTLVFGGFAAVALRSRSSASPACSRFRSARARASSASGWRSARSRGTCWRAVGGGRDRRGRRRGRRRRRVRAGAIVGGYVQDVGCPARCRSAARRWCSRPRRSSRR